MISHCLFQGWFLFGYSCAAVDAVTVLVNIGGERSNIGVFCGKKRPHMLMSNDNRMEVSFVSRYSSQHTSKGFKAEYRFVTGLLHTLLQFCYTFCYRFVTHFLTGLLHTSLQIYYTLCHRVDTHCLYIQSKFIYLNLEKKLYPLKHEI